MHFWIDKRSQQCGFGRSRVAASLSHVGTGLSYGYPPRRMSGNKSISSHSMVTVHNRQQQQQQQTNQHHYHHTSGNIITTADCHASCNLFCSNNNISSHNTATTNHLNNNVYLQQQQQPEQQILHANSSNSTLSNNNNVAITSSAAVLTCSRTVVPVAANIRLYERYRHYQQQQQTQQQRNNDIVNTASTVMGTNMNAGSQHYDVRSYHHPQFGNMAVRPYPRYQQQQNSPQQQSSADQQQRQQNLRTLQMEELHQTRQSPYHAAPRRINSNSSMHSTVSNSCTPTISMVGTNNTHSNNNNNGNNMLPNLAATQSAIMEHTDSELLSSHLKCNICASLLLISVFVAGAKFYFDHQENGLEVLIFCAFSATFFLAACTVLLCRVPKSLLEVRTPRSRLDDLAMYDLPAGGTISNGTRHGHACGVQYSHPTIASQQATAGPPPYHIAILLPEHNRLEHSKHVPAEESPPPSYDKILM